MSDIPDPREENLPRWARDELGRLRAWLRTAQTRADQARLDSGPEDSNTFLDPYDDIPVRLGRGIRVRFIPAESTIKDIRNWIDVSVDRWGDVEVSAGARLAVEPRSSNVIKLRVME